MSRRAPRPRLETGTAGDGPADTATVVIAIDGSSASRAAFCWGCAEARRLGGRAVAVFTSPQAEDQATMLREAAGLDLAFLHAPGNPVAGLLRIATEVHADLIVAGDSVGQRLAGRRRESVIVVVPSTVRRAEPAWRSKR